MKYSTKSKQNLDGVQTLTDDPLATYRIVDGNVKKIKRSKKRK